MSNLVRRNGIKMLVVLAAVLLLSTSGYRHRAGTAEGYGGLSAVMEELTRLDAPVAVADGVVCSIAMANEVRQVYLLNGPAPVWTGRKGLNADGTRMLGLLLRAKEYGLNPADYHAAILSDLSRKGNVSRGKVEVLLTEAALKMMVNLRYGYLGEGIDTLQKTVFSETLAEGVRNHNPVAAVLSVQPAFHEYVQLQKATAHFVRTADINSDSLEVVLPAKDSAALYRQVKRALVRMGYAEKRIPEDSLRAAIRSFQVHHGLEPDGRLGKNTLEAMNRSTEYKYQMLVLNLDRLRKTGAVADRQLWVNIPAYRLKVFENNRLKDSYNVIVGNPKTPTPQLSSQVIRVITNPVWMVPPSITRKELLPKIMADSNYMRRNRLRVVNDRNEPVELNASSTHLITNAASGYRIRQDAGSDNSLGRVKFIFPNGYSVYLHDTPARSLFSKDLRALSHGCVRVQDPERLADYLAQPGWTGKVPLSGLIAAGKRREIELTQAVPIRITYLTCEGDAQGEAYFYRDIYRNDPKDMEALAQLAN